MIDSLRKQRLSATISTASFTTMGLCVVIGAAFHSVQLYLAWVAFALAPFAVATAIMAKDYPEPAIPWPRSWRRVLIVLTALFFMTFALIIKQFFNGSNDAPRNMAILVAAGLALLIAMKIMTLWLKRKAAEH
jgi:hypothetical protein